MKKNLKFFGRISTHARRGSKRLSITCSDQDGLEAKKLKAALEGLSVSTKQKQKEFTWDVKADGDQIESSVKAVPKSKRGNKGAISSDDALAILGFTNVAGKVSKPRHISEYTEDEVLTAFQTQCKTLSILFILKCTAKHPLGHSVHNNTDHFLWSRLEKLAIMGQKLISYHIESST